MDGQTAKDVAQMVLDFIREIGSAFMDTGFRIALQRVQFLAIKSIIIAVVFVVISILTWNLGKKWWKRGRNYKEYDMDYDEGEMLQFAAGFSYFLSVAVWIVVGVQTFKALDYFINPEWNAIMLIMNLIGVSGG